MKTYSFQILKFQSHPTSGEFLNIGVFVQEGNTGMIIFKLADVVEKLQNYLHENELANIKTYLQWVAADFMSYVVSKRNPKLSVVSQRVLPPENARLCLTEVKKCLGLSLEECLRSLFELHVSTPNPK